MACYRSLDNWVKPAPFISLELLDIYVSFGLSKSMLLDPHHKQLFYEPYRLLIYLLFAPLSRTARALGAFYKCSCGVRVNPAYPKIVAGLAEVK